MSPPSPRIYVAGAHSTGKTTLARWISKAYDLPLVTEVARAVLAEMEIGIADLRVDLERTRKFQFEVFKRQAEAEDRCGSRFVSDRACDNLAYAATHTLALCSIAVRNGSLDEYMKRLKLPGVAVFFVRPHASLCSEDGTRERPEWDDIIRIDGMVRMLLELWDIDYVSIATPNMAERARAVRAVLRGMSVHPKEDES